MTRVVAFAYGILCYVLFLAVFLYFIAFVGDVAVPRSVDAGLAAPLAEAIVVNLALIALFALQHSGMARPGFKRWWKKLVPASVERSTYVLFASLALGLLCWQWRPIPGTVWEVDNAAGQGVLWGLFALGWGLVLAATFMIDHFHLFGLQQVYRRLRGREPAPPRFQTPGLYKLVRHPLNLGFLLAFWAIPHMTWGHLLLAVGFTGHILVSIPLEERDLIRHFGDRYRLYKQRVPTLFPGFGGGGRTQEGEEPT